MNRPTPAQPEPDYDAIDRQVTADMIATLDRVRAARERRAARALAPEATPAERRWIYERDHKR